MGLNMLGDKEFKLKLEKMKEQMAKAAEREIAKTLLDMHSDTTRKLQQGTRSGTIYRKGKNRTHQASAQGEYPKTDTGQLVASLFYEMDKQGRNVTGKFGSKAAHGKHLEYKPAAEGGRPWLKPQFDKFSERLRDRLLELNKKYLT